MLFFFRKLIEAMLLPIGISGLLVLAGVIFRRRWLPVAGVVVLYAFSTQVVGRVLLEPLEAAWPARAVADAPTADAIVVLGGAIVHGATATGVQWGEAVNRFFAGLDLAGAGKANLLVLSGGPIRSQGAILRDAAIRRGIPPDRVLVLPSVNTTEDEALAVSRIPNIRSILLVTSAYHMPRAVMLFRARGLDVFPFPTDARVLAPRLSAIEFIPDSDGMRSSDIALREYYGLAVYHLVLFFHHVL